MRNRYSDKNDSKKAFYIILDYGERITMKKFFLILLILSQLLLPACGAAKKTSEPTVRAASEPIMEETSERTEGTADATGLLHIMDDYTQAEKYYRYLSETVLDENTALAPIEPQKLKIDTMNFEFGWDLWRKGGTGLLSAFLEDFDNDGDLEMLAVFMEYVMTINTKYKYVYFEPGTDVDSNTSEINCIVLYGVQYDLGEDGEIYEKTAGEFALMPTDCWGTLLVGIEKVDDRFYVFAKSNTENMSTYGPSAFTVSGLKGNNLNWLYCSPFDYGRANFGNYNEIFDIDEPMDIASTTLSTLKISNDPVESLGNRLLCFVDFDYVEYGGDDMIVTATDYTGLRTHLDSSGSTWEKIELPQGGTIELPQNSTAEASIRCFVDQIASAAGTSFTQSSVDEDDSILGINFVSEAKNQLYISWDKKQNRLNSISLTAVHELPDAEWTCIKDAILNQPELCLDSNDGAILSGEVKNWTEYMSGITLGNYMFRIFAINYAIFSIIPAQA